MPNSICSLTNLEELVIYNNAFYGKLPNQMANLTNLKVLLIGNNDFKGELVELKKLVGGELIHKLFQDLQLHNG